MSTATAPAPSHSHAPLSRLTFGGILRSEWIKLRSLRSTFWCYALILVLNVGFAALIAASGAGTSSKTGMSTVTTLITLGLNFTVLISAVLGALTITGEYGTGMIKSTFAADPKRLGVLVGKALVFGVTTFLVGLLSLILAALVSSTLLSSTSNVSVQWDDGAFWLALVGGAGYLALAGLLAMFIGAIIRSSAGGIAAGIGLLFVANIGMSLVGQLTSATWAKNVTTFLPSNAGGLLFRYGSGTSSLKSGVVTLDQTQGLLVLLGWILLAGMVAVVLVRRRDVE